MATVFRVRWAIVHAINVKFSQDLTHQKSLKSVNFDRVIGKIKRKAILLWTQCIFTTGSINWTEFKITYFN